MAFHTNYAGLLEPLASDAAYLHAAALGTHIYIGLMFDKPEFVEDASPHFPKALRLLRKRLASADESEKTSDSTIIVVVALALYARTRREYVTARHHIQGILKMAELRGSITGIHDRAMLAMEVFRYSPQLALHFAVQLTNLQMRYQYSARNWFKASLLRRIVLWWLFHALSRADIDVEVRDRPSC